MMVWYNRFWFSDVKNNFSFRFSSNIIFFSINCFYCVFWLCAFYLCFKLMKIIIFVSFSFSFTENSPSFDFFFSVSKVLVLVDVSFLVSTYYSSSILGRASLSFSWHGLDSCNQNMCVGLSLSFLLVPHWRRRGLCDDRIVPTSSSCLKCALSICSLWYVVVSLFEWFVF